MNKPTLTIGISAFNEEHNIGLLLEDIRSQEQDSYSLLEIIIQSDGSTDSTVEVVKKYNHGSIKLFANKDRRGVAYRQNQIFSIAQGDMVVLLNADIRIKDKKFICKLIRPLLNGIADLTSPTLTAVEPSSFFESVLITGANLRRLLFVSWKNGQNGYLCQGAVRAFSKRLYTNIRFSDSGGEDMYSYLICKKLGFNFISVTDARALFKHPTTLSDHFKQSIRFFKFQNKLSQTLDRQLILSELSIPVHAILLGALKAIPLVIQNPLKVSCYILIVIFMRIRSQWNVDISTLWNASSTKKALTI